MSTFHRWTVSKVLLTAVLTAFLIFLLVDIVRETTESDVQVVVKRPIAVAGSGELPFVVESKLSQLTYAVDGKRLHGKLLLRVTAVQAGDAIEFVSFSLGEDREGGRFFSRRGGDSFSINHHAVPSEGGPMLSHVELEEDIELPVTQERHALFYPFDRISFTLALEVCVNDRGACYGEDGGANVDSYQVPALVVDTSAFRQKYDIRLRNGSGKPVQLMLQRDSFIRLISVYFVIIVIIFLRHIVRTQIATDVLGKALGLFAALWGLRQMLVPKDFEQFPTLVDYAVFLIYSVLFAIIVLKIQPEKERAYPREEHGT